MIIQKNLPLSKDLLNSWVIQIAEQHSKGALIIDPSHNEFPIIYCNDAFKQTCGYNEEEINGHSLHFLNGKKTGSTACEKLQNSLELMESFQQKLIHYRKDGTAFWHELTCHPMKDANNQVQYLLIYSENITGTALSRMISKLEREVYGYLENDHELRGICQLITEKIEAHYVRDLHCCIYLIQKDGNFEIVGHGSLPLRFAQQLTKMNHTICNTLNEDSIYTSSLNLNDFSCKQYLDEDLQISLNTKWLKPIYSQTKQLKGYISFYFKNEEKINEYDIEYLNRIAPLIMLAIKYGEQKKELMRLAYYDPGINIPNSHYFRIHLQEQIEQKKEGIVILIQPGEFSNIVDLYGRSAGEELLKQMVERLNLHRNNQVEFIARFSNSLIISSEMSHEDITKYDSRIRGLTLIPYFLAEQETYITLKVGIGFFKKGSTVDDSIRQADMALTKARHQSGTNVAVFEAKIDEKLKVEMNTLNQLNNGLLNDEFTVHLQPKINIKTGRIEGFEALSRWHSNVLGHVSPGIFIPLAEQAGRIKEIDSAVLRKTLTWLSDRLEKNLKIVPVAVNISPEHFYDDHFLDDMKKILSEYNVPFHYIKFELTESIELVDFTKAKAILSELKVMGIDCSIDDFGVGFSSLSYLPKLPFSEIKIDRSFISAMQDTGMYAVIQTIIQLATNLQMRAVAEGIETLEQYIMLKNMGCHTGQGFFLHKPMPIEVASALLDSI